ncbi:MAG: 50S ribosomal protein L29 [Candidatus Riflebacteria bacterium]|nr:50S ribosomal protein L29 [Candidatus Riflebacteria bacterium]
MKAKALKELSDEELAEKYRSFKDELFNLRFRLAVGQLDKVDGIRRVRRDLARVLTVMHQKKRAAGESASATGGKS